MVNCEQTPCRLSRRRIDLRGKAGSAPLAMGLMIFGLGFALMGLLIMLPMILSLGNPLVILGGGLFTLIFCGLSLAFAALGAMFYAGRQTELMAQGAQQAMLCLDLNGWIIGGYHYTQIESVQPELPSWPLERPASLSLVETESDNAAELVEGALLNLLALNRAELSRSPIAVYLFGRRFMAQNKTYLFFRPCNQIVPSGSLERELWDLLRRWEREGGMTRGPVGMSIGDLIEDFFERRTLSQPAAALCRQVRAQAEKDNIPAQVRSEQRIAYQHWLESWRTQQPELAHQLRREIEDALFSRQSRG